MDFGSSNVNNTFNFGQILSPKELIANQFNYPASHSYLQQMVPFSGRQSNSN